MDFKSVHPDAMGFSQFKVLLREWQKASGRGLSMRPANGQNHWAAERNMPPAHSAVARRTSDWVRGQAAKIGVATAAYYERLLTGRDHIE